MFKVLINELIMRCIVPGCRNDSRNVFKSEGISFHAFPTEPSDRTSWLKAIGIEPCVPQQKGDAVCSKHFLDEDVYFTKHMRRRLHFGAVPVVLQDSTTCDNRKPELLRICRICLLMDTKLLSMKSCNLETAYSQLTGLQLEDSLPQEVCWECAQRVRNCARLRARAVKAHALMSSLHEREGHLSMELMRHINRERYQLTSNLSISYYDNDHTDLYIYKTDDTQTEMSDKMPQTPQDIAEVKVEMDNDIFLEENDNFHQEDEDVDGEVNKTENTDVNTAVKIDNVNLGDTIRADACDAFEKEIDKFLAASENDFSSDDSLPLKVTKSVKKVKKKTKEKAERKVRKKLIKKPGEPKIDRRRKPFLNADLNETLFTIKILTVEEQLAEMLKRRESANYKNSVYKCTECYKGFLEDEAYRSHMLKHSTKCGEYVCDICKSHFPHPNALRKHITAHHTQKYTCNECPFITTHRQTARLHERWHKGTSYKCPHCAEVFIKFTTYMGHIRIKHPSDFVCGLCGFSFISAKGIDLHKKLKHRLDDLQVPADGPHCAECDVRFASAQALRNHLGVSARHATAKDDKPREPNKMRPRKVRQPGAARGRAEKKMDGEGEGEVAERRLFPSQMRKAEGPIDCEQCGVQLEDSRAYHSHFRRVHPDKNRTNYPSMKSPCMCEVCGKIFQSYALLRDHTWLHTGERPFKCDACGKAFRMKQRLVAHRRVHSQTKPTYVCAVCGKHFSTHSNRQRHMFIHTGLRPFKCEMCGKGFKHFSEKRAHVEYVHLKKPWPKRSRGKRRQSAQAAGASETDAPPPPWAACEAKMGDVNMLEDKPVYYSDMKL